MTRPTSTAIRRRMQRFNRKDLELGSQLLLRTWGLSPGDRATIRIADGVGGPRTPRIVHAATPDLLIAIGDDGLALIPWTSILTITVHLDPGAPR